MTKDDLIEEVNQGRMTPEAAEAEAERLGIGPLRRVPVIDVMAMQAWSIHMALSWIVWRKPQWVARFSARYIEESEDWFCRGRMTPEEAEAHAKRLGIEPPRGGSVLRSPNPATLLQMRLWYEWDVASGRRPHTDPDAARDDLWRKLGDDAITVSAIKDGVAGSCLIEAYEWERLALADDGALLFEGGRIYRDVKLSRADIIKNWAGNAPEQSALPVGVKTPSPKTIENSVQAIIAATETRGWPKVTEGEALEMFAECLPGASGLSVKTALRELRPAHWLESKGPRKRINKVVREQQLKVLRSVLSAAQLRK
jgi:hypothetical protein